MSSEESLAEKLARLAPHLVTAKTSTSLSPAETNPAEARRYEPEQSIGPDSVGAVCVSGSRGRYWKRRSVHDPADPWGETILSAIIEDAAALNLRVPFDGSGDEIPLTHCLFVDCETTGLSGGAGTIPFLTAVGQLSQTGFAVEQYFLPDPAEEAGKLDQLWQRFEEAEALVTYNGASFDLPLLEGRFHFWRLDPSFRELPHFDLLWPTRAIFRQRIGECSLGNVEARLLKYARTEDLPGAEVPEVYFQYLREGQSPRLHTVFEHNRLDVVSLFVYALWLTAMTAPGHPTLPDPDDLVALARYWFRRRQYAAAHAALDEATQRALSRAQSTHLSELRGRVHKRERHYDAAHTDWEHVAHLEPDRVDAAEEMAKHLEHRRRDYRAALAVVDRALEHLRVREALGEESAAEQRERLLHRRARLKRLQTAQDQ
jgi:hypothetical protein